MPLATANLEARLASILEASHLQSEPHKVASYAIDEVIPSAVVKPRSAAEVAEIVRFAIAENLTIIPVGSRSKLAIGMPPARYDIALDMTSINQIAHYDPGDLTLSVDAGCTLATISGALEPQNQFLPLPSAFGSGATIAGTIASGVDSHLRQFYGTVRDFLVGAEFVDGTGARCKSGGRVVKNVTGYDLHKLLIGSLGTLGIITRLNFRTFPTLDSAGSQTDVFSAAFADTDSASAFRHKIASSAFTPDAIEILSPEASDILSFALSREAAGYSAVVPKLSPPPFPSSWNVVVLFHGTSVLRARYAAALADFAQQQGTRLSNDTATAAFHAVEHLRAASCVPVIFKITQLPGKLAKLFAALGDAARRTNIPHALVARGLGVVYFALLREDPLKHLDQLQVQAGLDQQAMEPIVADAYERAFAELSAATRAIFEVCAANDALAQIQFAPTAVKNRIGILGPERPDAPAMRCLKSAFDPQNIFAPERMFQQP
jgi:glycolate oxidase FAD binding subunit